MLYRRFVWLASYPRSGNTWMRMALASLRDGGAEVTINGFQRSDEVIASHRDLFDDAMGIDSADLTEAETLAARPAVYTATAPLLRDATIWKVHEACIDAAPGRPLFPPEVTLAAIHVVRDPRDVAVSFADFAAIPVDEAVERMANPGNALSRARNRGINLLPQPLLDWSGHAASWLDRPTFAVTTIRYEDMLAEPETQFRRAATAAGIACNAETLRRAVAATRFTVLRDQEDRLGFKEKMHRQLRFFRRGVSGGWRHVLTPRQSARIESDHRAMMTRLGYL
jgi:aryl sulfotransferase